MYISKAANRNELQMTYFRCVLNMYYIYLRSLCIIIYFNTCIKVINNLSIISKEISKSVSLGWFLEQPHQGLQNNILGSTHPAGSKTCNRQMFLTVYVLQLYIMFST